MSYTDRVRKGIALLDDQSPGWHRMVDVDVLRIDSCIHCVLGQLYGSYTRGQLEHPVSHPEAFGFNAPILGSDAEEARAFRVLTRLWAYVVRQRQEAERAS